jgi:hypothetical protein
VSPDTSITVGGRELDPVRAGLLALVIGIGVAGFGAVDYLQQGAVVDRAVEVEATIVETEVTATSGGSSSTGADYQPRVTFSYEYDGQSYTASGVFPGAVPPSYDTESAARAVLEGYEPGATVTAHVDPESPDSAFLEPRRTNTPLVLMALGGLFAVVGAGSVLRA